MRAALVVGLGLLAATAHADGPRRLHGSLAAGGSLLVTGDQGDRLRADVDLVVKPGSRYGGSLAWRWFDQEHRGAVLAGLVFEGAAARPRLVVDLHADAGADLDQRAPIVGGGIRTTLTIIGPLGVVLDPGVYVVVDGFDGSRAVLAGNALLALRW